MKLIIKNGILLGLLCSVVCLSQVNAASTYFTNSNGVEMNELQYNKMLEIFSETKVNILTQEEFDRYKDANLIKSDVIYEKETYRNKELISTERITEEEFNNAPESDVTPYGGDSGFVETSYKRLGATVSDGGGWTLTGALSWKKRPSYQSYDVFAYRLTHFNYSGFSGNQVYIIGGKYYSIGYNTSSEGYKAQASGAGVSMNLKDGSDITGYELSFVTGLRFNTDAYSQAHAYVSYQHAQANLTRAQSMDYTLGISGLGNVIKFNDSDIAEKYDGMSGVHLTVPIS